jgi:hypothetical protein
MNEMHANMMFWLFLVALILWATAISCLLTADELFRTSDNSRADDAFSRNAQPAVPNFRGQNYYFWPHTTNIIHVEVVRETQVQLRAKKPIVLQRQAVSQQTVYKEPRTSSSSLQRIRKRRLDFLVAGFPKFGTTTLLHAFQKHPETSISNIEKCDFASVSSSHVRATKKLNEALNELNVTKKRGIKCPRAITTFQTWQRLDQHSPYARYIIGLRHPVELLASFYNYRVTEHYDKALTEVIPSFSEIMNGMEWNGVSLDIVRYDLYLAQLKKTKLTKQQVKELASRKELPVLHTRAKVFLYTLDQLEDTSAGRSKSFRKSLQHFLDLKRPFEPMGHENLNNFVGETAHPETIDICEDQYKFLRSKLIAQGQQTAKWILEEFVQSRDVSMGNMEHFANTLDRWSVDPCDV